MDNWNIQYVAGNPETRFNVTTDASNPQKRSTALAGAKISANGWRVWVEHKVQRMRIFESDSETLFTRGVNVSACLIKDTMATSIKNPIE